MFILIMPGGRNTLKRSGRGRGAIESGGKRLRSSKGTDEVVEILQFGNMATQIRIPQIHMRKVMQSNQHVLQILTLANFVDFEQIIRDSDISLQTSGRSQTSEINPNVLAIPSNTQESFNLTRGEATLRLGGRGHVRTCTSTTVSENLGSSVYKYCSPIERKCGTSGFMLGGILHISDKGQLESRPRITKDKVPTINKWTDAFLTFLSIYLQKYPNKTQELLQYMSIIREAANRSSLSW